MGKVDYTYANSLFELAHEHGCMEEVYGSFEHFIEECYDKSEKFLLNPLIDKALKKELIEEISSSYNSLFKNYLKVLIDKRRESILKPSFNEYRKLYMEKSGSIDVRVISAFDLDDEQTGSIKSYIKKLTGKAAVVETVIDKSIINGYKLIADGIEIDGSLDGALSRLKEELKKKIGVRSQ